MKKQRGFCHQHLNPILILIPCTTEMIFHKVHQGELRVSTSRFLDNCIDRVKSCLKDGRMHKKDIDNVVLVGGSTWIPKVKQMLAEFF